MTLQSSGAISFSQIRAEYGPTGAVSMSDYYDMGKNDGATTTFQSSGAISTSDFYGAMYDVKIRYTANNTNRTPRKSLARYIHIYVIGAGGSGGSCEIDTGGLTTGNGASSGGGAGGVAYSKVNVSDFTGSFSTACGSGGAGVTSAEDSYAYGKAGGLTSLNGNGLSMVGYGGARGNAWEQATSGGDTSNAPSAAGGTATGGNVANYTGGSSGQAYVTGDQDYSATGGGGINFVTSGSNDSGSVGNNATSAGGKCSDDSNPTILTTYLSNRGQAIDFTEFDGSDGKRNANSASPLFGSGSGGCAHGAARTSGQGGDGCVIFVYEV